MNREQEGPMALYICNGLKSDCTKTDCFYLGNGECYMTTDKRYAIDRRNSEPVQDTNGKE